MIPAPDRHISFLQEFFSMGSVPIHTLLLVLASLLWGSTFVMLKAAIESGFSVSFFLGARYLLAAVVLFPWVWRVRKAVWRDFVLVMPIGLAIFVANFLQVFGLHWTTAANSAFITGLYFVFTPIFGWLFWRTRLEPGFGRILVLAFIGFFLLCWNEGLHFSLGDILTLLGAIAVALQILWIDRAHARGVRVESLAFYQNFWVGLPSLGLALLLGELPANTLLPAEGGSLFIEACAPSGFVMIPGQAWFILIFTALACSALAFWAQAVGQRRVPPARAALIFTLEPLSGALLDYGLHGVAPLINLSGGGLILLSLVLDWLQRRKMGGSLLVTSDTDSAGAGSP